MRIISVSALRDFWEKHSDAEQPLRAWHHYALKSDWKTPQDIKAAYASASILADNRVVFNIKDNDYRLLVKVHYNTGVMYVRFVGTHAEYDDINAEDALKGRAMDIRPLRSEKDYRAALGVIETLMDAAPGSVEEDTLDVLATLVEAYEAKHYPILPPDPVEAILFQMERLGISRKELAKGIGGRGRVSEVLNRQRPLTIKMMRYLSVELDIPADTLMRPYLTQKSKPTARKARATQDVPSARNPVAAP